MNSLVKMDIIFKISRYYRYFRTAKSRYRIHSPFVFDFCREVLIDLKEYPEYQLIESRRRLLKKNDTSIKVTDFGAGSSTLKGNERKISDIAKTSLKRKKYAQLLFRIARYFQPESTLELGTSLGITSAYIGAGYQRGTLSTVEGCPEISRVAQAQFGALNIENIRPFVGNFDEVLPEILEKIGKLDMVFIDGNHREEPTYRYFEWCLKYSNNDTVFIFDDIHWSEGMEAAWEKVKAHPQVTLTMDLFELGLVFIRKEQKVVEHFVLKY